MNEPAGDLYVHAAEVLDQLQIAIQKAGRIYELALERRGPMNNTERNETREAADDLMLAIQRASVLAEQVREITKETG